MDLRFAAFELITRDATLRALLVNHADHLDRARGPKPPEPGCCFLALAWGTGDRPGSALLTARVHLPRRLAGGQPSLDTVLARLRTALTTPAARGALTARCLAPPHAGVEEGDGTVFRTGLFEISPAPPRGSGAALLALAPWPAPAPVEAVTPLAPRGAVPSTN
jgi:hypothetical protein